MAENNLLNNVKDFWGNAENKWYSFLDSLDSKGIPVYKVIDPIDKIVPSLALVIALFFVFIFLIAFFFLFSGSSLTKVQFLVQSNGVPVSGLEVFASQSPLEEKGFSGIDSFGFTDEQGIVVFNLFSDSSVWISIQSNEFDFFENEFNLIDYAGELIEINLTEKFSGPEQVSIDLKDVVSQQVIRKQALISFNCSQGPSPSNRTIYTGTLTIDFPKNCGELSASVSIDGYHSNNGSISGAFKTFWMQPIETDDNGNNTASFAELIVNVVNEENLPLSNVLVSLTEKSSGFQINSHLTDSSGIAVFYSINPNLYVVEAYDSDSGARKSKEIQLFEDDSRDLFFELNTNVVPEKIYLEFLDFNSLNPVENVKVNVFVDKELSNISGLSDSDGLIELNFSNDFNQLAVLAFHEDYVSVPLNEIELKSINDEPETILLNEINLENNGIALVKVFDDPSKGEVMVNGAKVKLINSRYNNLNLAWGSTQENGVIEFTNLPLEGEYTALASLNNVQGESDSNSLIPGEENEFLVFLDNPATFDLMIIVQNHNGIALNEASIKLINSNKAIEGITNDSGLFEIELPVNELFELIVEKENYLTSSKPLLKAIPGEQRIESIILYPENAFIEPEMVFEGYYSANNKGNYLNGFIEKNKSYYAVISLIIPENEIYSEILTNSRLDLDSKKTAEEIELVFTDAIEPENALLYFLNEFNENNIFEEKNSQGTEFKAINSKLINVSGKTKTFILKFFVKNWAHEGKPPIPLHYQNNYRSPSNENTLPKKTKEFIVSNCDECFQESYLYYFKLNDESINPRQRTELNLERNYFLEVILKNNTLQDAENLEIQLTDESIPGLRNGENPEETKVLEFNPQTISIEFLETEKEFSEEILIKGLLQSANAKLDLKLNSFYPNDDAQVLFKIIPREELLLTVNQTELLEKQLRYLITGTVQDSQENKISNALIKFNHNPIDSAVEIIEETFSDANGFFSIELNEPLFAPTPLIVSAEKAGYLLNSIEIPVKNETRFESKEKPDCIQLNPVSQELSISRGNIAEIEIKNLCNQNFDAIISSVNTSDIKFLLNENPNERYSITTRFNAGETKKIYVKSFNLAGLHPINLNFNPIGEELLNSFSTKINLTVFPQSTDAFNLIGRDDGQQRYEFNLVHSADKIRATYNGFTPQWIDASCNAMNLNNCPPWITGLESNTRNINPNNSQIWFSSIEGIEFDYFKVFLDARYPGLGLETPTGILASTGLRTSPFAPTLKINTSKTGNGIVLIKFGIGSDALEEKLLIDSLQLKLTASEDSDSIKFNHFYNIDWTSGQSFNAPIPHIDETSFFTSQKTTKDNAIIIDLKNAGIHYKGIYAIALSVDEGNAEIYSRTSTLHPICLIVNGIEYCGIAGELGDCFFDLDGHGRSSMRNNDFWNQNWKHLPENEIPDVKFQGERASCVYCATSSGFITEQVDGVTGAETGCYGDVRQLFFNPDGTIKEGFYLQQTTGGEPPHHFNYYIAPRDKAEQVMKENCIPLHPEGFNYTAKLRVYNASEEAQTQEKEEDKLFLAKYTVPTREPPHSDRTFNGTYYDSTPIGSGGGGTSSREREDDEKSSVGSYSCDFSKYSSLSALESACPEFNVSGGSVSSGTYGGWKAVNQNDFIELFLIADEGKEIDLDSEGFIELVFSTSGSTGGGNNNDSGECNRDMDYSSGVHSEIDLPELKRIEFQENSVGLMALTNAFTSLNVFDSFLNHSLPLSEDLWGLMPLSRVGNEFILMDPSDNISFGNLDLSSNKKYTLRIEWDEENFSLLLDDSVVSSFKRNELSWGYPLNPIHASVIIGAVMETKFINPDGNVPSIIYSKLSVEFNERNKKQPGGLKELLVSQDIGFLSDPRISGGGINFSSDLIFSLGEGFYPTVLKDVKFTCDGSSYEILEESDFRKLDESLFSDVGYVFKGSNAPFTGFITFDQAKNMNCRNGSFSFYARNGLSPARVGSYLFVADLDKPHGWIEFFALIAQRFFDSSYTRFGFNSRNTCAPPEQYAWNKTEKLLPNEWMYYTISWSPGWDPEGDLKEKHVSNELFFSWGDLPEKTKAMLAGDKVKFLPGEPRNLVDIDLINTGFDGVKYGVIGLADYKEDMSGINSGFIHSKFIGSSGECVKFTGTDKIIGETSTERKAKIAWDYSWNNRYSRCNAVESGVYCDSTQFMQKISSQLEQIQNLLSEGISVNSNEFQRMLSFNVKLKYDGLSRDLVNDFRDWAIAGGEGEIAPMPFIEMQDIYSDLIDFRLLGDNLETISETNDLISGIELPGPGFYKIDLEFDFKDSLNPLIIQGNQVKVNNIRINLRKISEPEQESVLYYLPFNSNLGLIDGTREGYGTSISGNESSIKEFSSLGIQEALVNLRIESITDFDLLNYAENRGSLIQIQKQSGNEFLVKLLMPYATPVLMLVSDDKFDAFYSLEQGVRNPADGLYSVGIWNGFASTMLKQGTSICTGFEENPLPRGFNDLTALTWKTDGFETSVASGEEQKAYGLSFKKTNSTGSFIKENSIGLYSVFYSTTHPVYGSQVVHLNNASTGNAVFIDPKSNQALNRIPLNYKQKTVLSLKDLIDLIEQEKNACIKAEKNSLDIFWNEDKLAFNAFQQYISNIPGINYCSSNQTQEYGYASWGQGIN